MMFCVYAHCRPAPDCRLFYIGKASNTARPYSRKNRNRHWHRVVTKHGGFDVRIIDEFDTEAEALAAEVELIALAREMSADIVNITDGGEGVSGMRHSAETRKRLSDMQVGKPGRPSSPEAREKIAASKRGKPRDAATRAKLSAALIGRPLEASRTPAMQAGQRARRAKESEEVRQRMRAAVSASAKARWQDPEFRAKSIAAMLAGRTKQRETLL
jgi:hypothetical protein